MELKSEVETRRTKVGKVLVLKRRENFEINLIESIFSYFDGSITAPAFHQW